MKDYLEIQRQVLLKGGDTDTNACIVGGLIGAAIGYDNLPKKQLEILLSCDCEKSAQQRDSFFNPKSIIPYIEKIIQIAPNKLENQEMEVEKQNQEENKQQFQFGLI
eukprot:TRINITY_DN9361_c0_g1_i5.p4 TRINITY_DN9361_c0_g1~~TRINITY_DN9361_c0_g1_i5.p4  ORF type:complete len:107 (+),score=26.12 TRINITY_DN9361_c0_g1_i5:658-978(+)